MKHAFIITLFEVHMFLFIHKTTFDIFKQHCFKLQYNYIIEEVIFSNSLLAHINCVLF
jgi:hypothetical protein